MKLVINKKGKLQGTLTYEASNKRETNQDQQFKTEERIINKNGLLWFNLLQC